jgi:integrase
MWDEINFDTGIWTVPGGRQGRMKMGREHRVPLSDAAVALLRAQWAARKLITHGTPSPYIFPAPPSRQGLPLSNMSMAMTMRRLGMGEFTVHGFRSSLRSWVAKHGIAPREVAEICLAHFVGDDTERAYQRDDMLERRRPVMQAWADHVFGHAATDKVVPMPKRA